MDGWMDVCMDVCVLGFGFFKASSIDMVLYIGSVVMLVLVLVIIRGSRKRGQVIYL